MDQQNQIINILKNSGVDIDEIIETCRLDSVKVNDVSSTWRLCLSFDEVLPCRKLKQIIELVTRYIKENFQIKNVKFTITYPNNNFFLSTDEIKEYFNFALDVCIKVKKGAMILYEYYKKYLDNEILFMVATEEEKKAAEDNLLIIKQFLINYGVGFIKLNTMISESVKNYKESQDEKQHIKEMADETKSIEIYKQKQQEARENKVQGTFSYMTNNKPTFKSINDLPTNSMEVEEFKQMEGTEKVQVLGTLVSSEIRNFRSRQGRDFTLLVASITNYKDTIMIKRFIKETEIPEYKKKLKTNTRLEVKGKLQWDDFAKDVVIMCDEIIVLGDDVSRFRFDEAQEKRVELHAHSKMSVLDSILDVSEYVKQAKQIAEDTKVALRRVRQEANDNIKKDEAVTEDDEKRMLEEVQQLINDYNKKVDEKYKEKEEELMKV